MNEQKYRTDWAYSEKLKKRIHINDAESGKKGYKCLGCEAEMIANKQKKNRLYKSYFRHHTVPSQNKLFECVRANKEYREKLAKDILNSIKQITVPSLYKLPKNNDINLLPNLIAGKKLIKAADTKANLVFYEDENGIVKWSKDIDVDEEAVLVNVDVTFFDNNDEPMLLILFGSKKKLTIDTYSKLSFLGINTLTVNIPSIPEEEIEKHLKNYRNYKWLYNAKEFSTEYIPVFKTDTTEILRVDENERIVFLQSFECRKHEIGELIRRIDNSLQSEFYRRTEFQLTELIQEAERDLQRERQRLGEVEESHREEALARNRRAEVEERKRYSNLERRYLTKREELRGKNFARDTAIKRLNDTKNANTERREELEENIKKGKREIKRLSKLAEQLQRNRPAVEARMEEEVFNEVRGEAADIEAKIRTLEEDVRAYVEGERAEFEQLIRQARRDKEIEDEEINQLQQSQENINEIVRREFDTAREDKNSRFFKRNRGLFKRRELESDYIENKRTENSYRAAREVFKKGTWKTW